MKDIIDRFAQGEFVIVTDSEDRENEGDFILAAQDMTVDKLNFLLDKARGFICVPMTKARLEELELPLMVEKNEEHTKCAFTLTVDSREGVHTGISAADRADVIKKLADPQSTSATFVRPGHISPLQAADGGLDEREGHTEAAVELCKLAGKEPVAVICEILNPDGTMARRPELEKISAELDIPLISIEALKEYIKQ